MEATLARISFDFNLATLLQPLLLIVVIYIGRQVRNAIIAHNSAEASKVKKLLDDQQLLTTKYQTETQYQLVAIKEQTTKTNGSVTHLKETDEELRIELNNLRVQIGEVRGMVYASQGLRPPEERE